MTTVVQAPTRTRDPQVVLNAVQPDIRYLPANVADGGTLCQAVAYTVATMEHKDVHLGVGKLVDIGVHQLILDTPVYFRCATSTTGAPTGITRRSSSAARTVCA